MQNPIQLRRKIVEIEEALITLELHRKKLLEKLRGICDHQIIVETPNLGSEPPMRICAFCSLEEEGWGLRL